MDRSLDVDGDNFLTEVCRDSSSKVFFLAPLSLHLLKGEFANTPLKGVSHDIFRVLC
jgi:hypothetical protein